MRMMKYFLLALVAFCACNTKKEHVENHIPGYNPEAISVNSIAPDRGLADPHVIIVGDTLFAMCGHDRDWNIVTSCQMDRWELWATTNLKDWDHQLSILPTQTYIGDLDNCWAGDVATKDGKYYWYFSNRNINTGVMVAPSMQGPWEDALGAPLLPKGLVATNSYDPEVYEEDGVYHIIFGAGQYYMATLGDDMISLADAPKKVMIYTKDGKRQGAGDKSTLFKRGDWYYLWWGYRYAMSKQLEGPYEYQGQYLDGGHGSTFQWQGQWYCIQENHETNAFYRGVQIRPLYFNADGTVYIPEHNYEYPLPGRIYNYEHSTQGWRSEKGTKVERNANEKYIYGVANEKGSIVTSVPFIHTPLHLCQQVSIRLKNVSGSKTLKLALNGYDDPKRFTRVAPQKVDWTQEEWVEVPLKKTKRWQEVTIPLSAFATRKVHLHQIAVQPVPALEHAEWIIKEVIVE